MKNTNDIKCPFCGGEMEIEINEYTETDFRGNAFCVRCGAAGPVAHGPTEARAEEVATKAMADYWNKVDADLWRASKGVR